MYPVWMYCTHTYTHSVCSNQESWLSCLHLSSMQANVKFDCWKTQIKMTKHREKHVKMTEHTEKHKDDQTHRKTHIKMTKHTKTRTKRWPNTRRQPNTQKIHMKLTEHIKDDQTHIKMTKHTESCFYLWVCIYLCECMCVYFLSTMHTVYFSKQLSSFFRNGSITKNDGVWLWSIITYEKSHAQRTK